MNNNETCELSKEEAIAFEELKRRINDIENERVADLKILRFLRARDFNVAKAECMLKKNLAWRKNEKVDTILQDYKVPEILEKYLPFYIAGFCTEGQPLLVLQFGDADVKGILKSIKVDDIIRYATYILEYTEYRLQKQSEKVGKLIERLNIVFNFENTTLLQVTNKACIQCMLRFFSCYEANYPERLDTAYVINVTAYFTIAINILKTVLAPATLRKVETFGKGEWKEPLSKIMDPSILQIFEEDRKSITGIPGCLTPYNRGGKIPKRYYLQNANNRFGSRPGFIKYKLKRSDKLDIPMNVRKAGSFLDWKFEIENYDIQFGLFYKKTADDNEQLKTLIEKQRVDADLEYETGSFFCQEPGIYVLTFDNSYSWFRQKQICCVVSVTEPEEKEAIISTAT